MHDIRITIKHYGVRLEVIYHDVYQPKTKRISVRKIITRQEIVREMLGLVDQSVISLDRAFEEINKIYHRLIDENNVFEVDNESVDITLIRPTSYIPIRIERAYGIGINIIDTRTNKVIVGNIYFEDHLETIMSELINKKKISPREKNRIPLYSAGFKMLKACNAPWN